MVRADLMNGIDVALRKNRNRLEEPFGGVQMVFIGDLFQLPPVVMETDREYILKTYGGQYFFDATVFKTYRYHFKELTTIFRQSNEQPEFKTMLNNIRNNEAQFNGLLPFGFTFMIRFLTTVASVAVATAATGRDIKYLRIFNMKYWTMYSLRILCK